MFCAASRRGGCYHEELLFSVCRVMVSPSLLQTYSKSSFSSSSLLLKAFKQQRLGCLPTWVLGCHGNTYRWTPPSVSVFLAPTRWKEARVSKQPAACCAGSASFQLKAFCAACAATWRGKGRRWEWLERREGGRMSGLPSLFPRQLDVTVTSHATKSF